MQTPSTTQVSTQGRHPWRAAVRTFVQTWVPFVALIVLALPEVVEAIDVEAGAYLSDRARGMLLGIGTAASVLAAVAARIMALDSVGRLVERSRLTSWLAPAPVVDAAAHRAPLTGAHRDDDGDGVADGARHYSLGLVAAAAAALMFLPNAVPVTAAPTAVPATTVQTLTPPSWCDPAYAVYVNGGWLCLGGPEQAATPPRIAGTDRYATAAAVSAEFWAPGEATVVYLANGAGIDAMTAGASVDGPVLLVPTGDQLPAVTRAELTRLAPVEVVGLGGPGAVSDAQLVAAQAAAGG